MPNPYKTCPACGEKDVTVRWREDRGALLCAPCNHDGAPRFVSVHHALTAPVLPALFTLSPAALRALAAAR